MPYNILLIDDDEDFREEIRDFLEDYEVIEASCGEEALRILMRPNEIDLVILDVRMPGVRGTKVLREIKKMAPGLGVVILTGFSTKDTAIEALKGRADDYLEKPVDIERLNDVIGGLLKIKGGYSDAGDEGAGSKIERVKRFVERNHHKRVSLEDAASVVCLSPKYLSRLFREVTGRRFTDYRSETKMERAKELLKSTGYSVSQISYKLGYQNTESLIRRFKKITGLTPSQYRRGESGKNDGAVKSSGERIRRHAGGGKS